MKTHLDRRTFLAGATGTLSLSLLPLKGWPALRHPAAASPTPAPIARIEVVKDTYFGETISDPYRWMENAKDPDWLSYLKAQNAHTRAIIDALPDRTALLKRIQRLSGDTVLHRAGAAGRWTHLHPATPPARRQLQAVRAPGKGGARTPAH